VEFTWGCRLAAQGVFFTPLRHPTSKLFTTSEAASGEAIRHASCIMGVKSICIICVMHKVISGRAVRGAGFWR
jgi:hypothetical protein